MKPSSCSFLFITISYFPYNDKKLISKHFHQRFWKHFSSKKWISTPWYYVRKEVITIISQLIEHKNDTFSQRKGYFPSKNHQCHEPYSLSSSTWNLVGFCASNNLKSFLEISNQYFLEMQSHLKLIYLRSYQQK